HTQAVAPLDSKDRAIGELEAPQMAEGRRGPERGRVTVGEAEDVLERRLPDRLLEPVEHDVAAIPHDGRDGEQGRPPRRRESPGATGPERPARQGAEYRVAVERASVGGVGGRDAQREGD